RLEVIEEALGADLGIVEQADRRAIERGERRSHARCLPFGVEARIEHTDAHGITLFSAGPSWITSVMASDFRPYHGGTITPKPPAGPPAATTSRSSGDRSAA